MTLNKIKPVIEEIDGIRCVIVESGIEEERADFLTKLLTHNNYTVKSYQSENKSITLGVTDLLFNPLLDVYKRKLKSLTNHKVTPAYWLQVSADETERQVNYWKESDVTPD